MYIKTFKSLICGLLLLALSGVPMLAGAAEVTRQPLFKIERSKNANIVQYDAQVGPDGKLLKKEPVVAYWIRHNEQGQIEELSWVQRTFAFGVKGKLEKGGESAELEMAADMGQPIRVIREGDTYHAVAPIEGPMSYLEKMYINATGKGIKVTVHYVEIFGKDMETGKDTYHKFFPE